MADLYCFPNISSSVNLRAEQFQLNKAAWAGILENFEEALRTTTVEGSSKSLSNHQSRGQLLGE